jgi:hypothetical protein
MKTLKVVAVLFFALGCVATVPARAEGLYFLGAVGGKTVYDQDFADYYGYDGYDYTYDPEGLAEGALNLGYRFSGPIALEASVALTEGRSTSQTLSYDFFGYPSSVDSLTVNPVTTVSLGPVFCWDRRSWWFAQSGVTELGLKVSYAGMTGNESYNDNQGNTGSQDFSGSAVGFGIFLRALNIWNPTGLNVGLEAGFDYQHFATLTVSHGSGVFADPSTTTMENASGGDAYIDNSGGYVRLVIGWSQPNNNPPPGGYYEPAPRRRFYRDDY